MSRTAEKMRTDLGDAHDLVSEAYDRTMVAWMAVSHMLEIEDPKGDRHLDRDQSNALIYAVGSALEAVRDARKHLDEAMG